MARILLTGGSGFIATHILKLLIHRGYVNEEIEDHVRGQQLTRCLGTQS